AAPPASRPPRRGPAPSRPGRCPRRAAARRSAAGSARRRPAEVAACSCSSWSTSCRRGSPLAAYGEAVVLTADGECDLTHRLLRRDLAVLLHPRLVCRDEEPIVAVGGGTRLRTKARAREHFARAFGGIPVRHVKKM